MIMGTVVAAVFVFGALVGYASCWAAARADHQSEAYFYLKTQEKDAERRNENLKNE